VVRTYDVYGVPYAESQARFREALEIIRQGWRGEPFSYTGEFYRVDNAIVTPRPYQVPHPPIRMATTSDETFPAAGRMGLPIFVGLRTTEIPDLQAQLAPYRQAWRDAGHAGEPSVYLRIPVYVSTTEKARWRSRARAWPHSSRARPSSRARRSDAPAPAPRTAVAFRPSAWPVSRTTTSWKRRWRSAPRPA
jgi:alkanesulfonate monooxygenase SsuD/methylene tetrahydromethanopterin reductase-like flavin-dependent oxidoreductase (luciferase family)